MPSYIADVVLNHPEAVLNQTMAAVPELTVELDYQVVTDAGACYLFVQAYGGDLAVFDRAVAEDATVTDSRVVVDDDECRVYRLRLDAIERLVLSNTAEFGLRILHATVVNGGWRATVEGQEREALAAFRSHCADRGVGFGIERLYRDDDGTAGGRYGLTPPQHEALLAAYERGYFEEPRQTSLSDVAEALDISRSAAGGRLRRAIENLVRHTAARSDAGLYKG